MRLPVAVLSALALIAMPAAANAAACKDAKGKFTKCPPAAAAALKPTPKTTTKVTAKTKASSGKMAGRCRNAKGQFAKCGTPGTHPA